MADIGKKHTDNNNISSAEKINATTNNTTALDTNTMTANNFTAVNTVCVNTTSQAKVPGKMPESQQEPALDYTVNHGLDANLQPSSKATANYLIHRMLFDQQDKLDTDDVAVSGQGTMEVQDDFDVQPRK